MTGPGTGKEGGEKSDRPEEKERKDNVKGEHKDGVDKSNTKERKESEKPKEKEKERDTKPEKPEQSKGKSYDDSNRVEREGKSPYELPKSVRPEQGPSGSYGHFESKSIDFPKGKDPKTQMEETRKKLAEDAERTKQEQRRLMSRLR